MPLPGHILAGAGGPVVMAAYEDHPSVIALRMRRLAGQWRAMAGAGRLGEYTEGQVDAALNGGGTLPMRGWPLYAPMELGDGEMPLWATSIGRAWGWEVLWDTVGEVGARLVIIDPAKSVYRGEANAQMPVQAFLDELALAAGVGGAAGSPFQQGRPCWPGCLRPRPGVGQRGLGGRGAGRADPDATG